MTIDDGSQGATEQLDAQPAVHSQAESYQGRRWLLWRLLRSQSGHQGALLIEAHGKDAEARQVERNIGQGNVLCSLGG